MHTNEIISHFHSDNEVQQIKFYGGLYGLLEGNQVKIINKRFKKINDQGWRVLQLYPEVSTDLLKRIIRIIVLFLTLFIFTWTDGYYVLVEKSRKKEEKEKLSESLFT